MLDGAYCRHLGVVVRTFIILLLLTTNAFAHSWYDHECCSDKDCHPIEDCDELIDNADGSVRWKDFVFSKERVKPSQDKYCHVCVYESKGGYGYQNKTPMCVYIQHGT